MLDCGVWVNSLHLSGIDHGCVLLWRKLQQVSSGCQLLARTCMASNKCSHMCMVEHVVAASMLFVVMPKK